MKPRTAPGSFVVDSIYNFVRQGLVILIGLATSIFLSRGLGVTGRGFYALVMLMVNLVFNITNLGIGPSTTYYVAHGDYSVAKALKQNFFLTLAISVPTILIGYLLSTLAYTLLFSGVPPGYLYDGLGLIPLMFLYANLRAILLGIQDFRAYNLIDVTSSIVGLAFTFLLVWLFPLGVPGSVAALMLSNLYGVAATIYYLRDHIQLKDFFLQYSPDWHYWRNILNYGFKANLANLVSFLSFRIDKFIVNSMAGATALGFYDLAVTLTDRLGMVSQAISSVLLVRVASMDGEGKYDGQFSMAVARNVLLITFLISVLIFPLSEWAIVILYGPEFRQVAAGLQWLLPGAVLLAASRVLSFDISGRGRPLVNSFHSVIVLAVDVAGNMALTPRYGFLGAAMAATISQIVFIAVKLETFCRMSGQKWYELFIITRQDIDLWKKTWNKLAEYVR